MLLTGEELPTTTILYGRPLEIENAARATLSLSLSSRPPLVSDVKEMRSQEGES